MIKDLIKLPVQTVQTETGYVVHDQYCKLYISVGTIDLAQALRDLINAQSGEVDKLAEEYAEKVDQHFDYPHSHLKTEIWDAVLYGSTIADDKWISVSERLPETDENVLIPNKNKVLIAFHDKEDSEWYTITMAGRLKMRNITHWQPLPELPKYKIES